MFKHQEKRGVLLPFVLHSDIGNEEDGSDTRRETEPPVQVPRGAGQRILVIDDEPAIGRLIQRVAMGCGYGVTLTTGADDFIDALTTEDPAVIVLDLAMPGVDGVELLRFLGTTKCRAQILIVSGFDPRVLETAAELGAALGLRIAGTLAKPLRVTELRAAINSLAERRVS